MDDQQVPRRPTAGGYGYLMLLAILFIMLSNGQNDPLYQQTLSMAIDRRIHQRARFSDWIYGNTTSQIPLPYPLPAGDILEAARLAEANRTFSMPDLREPDVDSLIDQVITSPSMAVYHHNITGFFKGAWKPLNHSLPPEPPLPIPTPVLEANGTAEANITDTPPAPPTWKSQRGLMPWLDEAAQRKVSLNVRETKEAQSDLGIAIVRGNLEFEADGTTARMDVEGLQYVRSLRPSMQGCRDSAVSSSLVVSMCGPYRCRLSRSEAVSRR
jgi:hypothetical protein